MTNKGECEHCGKSREEPIVVDHEGVAKSFCSAACVMESEMGGAAGLWRALGAERDLTRRAIEEERNSKVITLIHRMELHNGTDQYIKMEDSEEILDEILSAPEGKPIDIIVHCPGGVVLAAEQIALALKEHKGKVSAIVPYYAMSGATLICLAADEIVMEPFSVLGPLDPQVSGFPSPSLLRLLVSKGPQNVSDEMVMMADIAEKSLRQMKSFIQYVLKDKMDSAKARDLAEYLTGGYLTHDSPLTAGELQSFGLRIVLDVSEHVRSFMRLQKLISTSSIYARNDYGISRAEKKFRILHAQEGFSLANLIRKLQKSKLVKYLPRVALVALLVVLIASPTIASANEMGGEWLTSQHEYRSLTLSPDFMLPQWTGARMTTIEQQNGPSINLMSVHNDTYFVILVQARLNASLGRDGVAISFSPGVIWAWVAGKETLVNDTGVRSAANLTSGTLVVTFGKTINANGTGLSVKDDTPYPDFIRVLAWSNGSSISSIRFNGASPLGFELLHFFDNYPKAALVYAGVIVAAGIGFIVMEARWYRRA
ncbi:MAG: ATP-dependent Clp protease proteolytic subunit [Nitrososphaerales archaeon]|nr:ATP-dependent Clp protease proteolytic subunit [Nitrososphaerales archaeon]